MKVRDVEVGQGVNVIARVVESDDENQRLPLEIPGTGQVPMEGGFVSVSDETEAFVREDEPS